MVNLITDGSLVGFWPLDEPSGTPIWKNHSAAFARAPSGISFDLTTAVADLTNVEEFMSVWPGQSRVVNPESGTVYTGYQVQGSWKLNLDSSPLSRYLVLNDGCSRSAQQIWQPNVAQSGFTVGFWVYPNSDGYENFQANATFASFSWETEAARAHTLVGAFQSATNDAGWHLGVSGIRSRGAQFGFDLLASKQLRAFAFIEQAGGVPTDSLNVPIESGRFTHIAYTFRFIDGTSNQIVLYKDGRVAASGTTSANLTASNTNLISASLARTLTVGASDDGTVATDDYERTSGWNHLVSGLYFFKRVLHEGEILDMHQQGGLQPTPSHLIQALETRLTSNYLVAYYPFMEPGYGDISPNQSPAISNFDAGSTSERVFSPGPFGFGGVFHNGTVTLNYHAVPSGTCYDLLENNSWTIGVWCSLNNNANRDDNIWLSWGSVTSSTSATAEPAASTLTLNTAAIVGTVSGIANQQRVVVEIYPRGDTKDVVNNRVFNIVGSWEYYNQAFMHLAIAYDDATKGLSVFINGHFAESGTLNHSLSDQLRRVAGSGYPLMFGNGVADGITDATNRGLLTGAGIDNWLGPVFLANRALAEAEIYGIVVSGIVDMSSVYRTRHDPRLVAYWPCTSFVLSDVIVLDEARAWSRVPGHLVRGDTLATDERWYDDVLDAPAGTVFRNDQTAFIDHFGSRTTPPQLASYGNLGITSGIFVAAGGSIGADQVADTVDSRSSYNNPSVRYKPVIEQRTLDAQNLAGEYIVSFQVTPSGRIPAVDIVRTGALTAVHTNCLLFEVGNQATSPAAGDSSYHMFLTSLNALAADPVGTDAGTGPSGVIIKIMGSEDTITGANQIPLVSGRLPFGVPSRVLVHTKFDDPFQINGITAGQSNFTISLWIDGTLIHRRTLPQVNSRIWSDGVVDAVASTNLIHIGGVLGNDTITGTTAWQGGLADIYMREIFVMKGIFLKDEVAALAASGIQSPSIAGYIDQKPTTQVTLADTTLEAYWRFNGFEGGGSGTTDLSFNNQHLFGAAQSYNEHTAYTQAAGFMRFAPAMFAGSTIGVQCSGISYDEKQITNVQANRIPFFMTSGVIFDQINNGFSIGFFLKKKSTVTTARFDALIAYGVIPTTASTTTVDYDYGWMIGQDDSDNLKMVISTSGNMYLSATDSAAMSGEVQCGVYGVGGKSASLDDLTAFDRVQKGDYQLPKLDAWTHYCWTYDPSDYTLRCYVNGEIVDAAAMKLGVNPANAIQIPADPNVRYITFFQHSTDPWVFNAPNIYDFTSVLADVFFFSRPLLESEIRYIALNGIDDAVGTEVSGIIGGFIYGADSGSGLIGGYSRGIDTGSGTIGGYAPGSIMCSGSVGGFIFANQIGLSGVCGGFLIGGLEGRIEFDTSYTVEALSAEDFDAQLEIAKTASSDFDAKLIVFQNEVIPFVDIIIPNATVTGVTPPFNQYFVGFASGQQGKTIVQTRWNFGDFSPTISVAESGASLYPVQHHFAASGFYIVRFEAIDSDGMHGSAVRYIHAVSGIDPVIVSLSGVPRAGNANLIVDFTTRIDILPPGVSLVARLLTFDDGQATTAFNPTHVYTEPGSYKPIWVVRDSRGVIWCDSLESGNDFLTSGGA